ncbi:hypothetical protein BU15DRAFT_84261 [Melanogaster broomeanus]|nr:hypothetical protein BU15DRAFT_84261 [Melanogaster broomeanus]
MLSETFTQHVQYSKTCGLVYISDYQGSTTLLTDPQILTHPDVGQETDLFSEGNIEIGVKKFEEEHRCNRYCKWSGFHLMPFQIAKGSVEDSKDQASASDN